MALRVCHSTLYRYRRPVTLAPHRLMLRPRDSHALRVVKTGLAISPVASVQWCLDVFGNSIAIATFHQMSDHLKVESTLTVEQYPADPFQLPIEWHVATYPFSYSAAERIDLGGLLVPQYSDPQGRLLEWARAFVLGDRTRTMALLADLNAGISQQLRYQSRDEEGTQSPLHTLERGWGACRDFAVLLVEAARWLGFGARLVTGYLDTSRGLTGQDDRGSTHAWADIFLPGAGWTAFDPTNGIVGEDGLIRVAVGREMGQIIPISGSFVGATDDFLDMTVAVSVTPEEEAG